MRIIADLQIHSRFSRATSQQMNLPEIALWAKKKGIQLIATGDWTHPLWFREIRSLLEEKTEGIYGLKKNNAETANVRFLLSTEISSVYAQAGKVRKIHNLIFSPSLQTAEKVNEELTKRGAKLMSDGRPVVGLTSQEIIEIVLTIDKNAMIVPAHIWTPWFSMFGSKSGFDSIQECFGRYSKYIYAIETGLSSDPLMNWGVKDLETRSILSFSDAHSGMKIGREATVFVSNVNNIAEGVSSLEMQYSYMDIIKAIKNDDQGKLKIGYTIEFFPEEGKYHWSGHRTCGICYDPLEVQQKGVLCPICKKPLTIGVENRVIELTSKRYTSQDVIITQNSAGLSFVIDREKKRKPFVSIIPLYEVLLEINNHSVTKSITEYDKLVTSYASEFKILLQEPYHKIAENGGESLAKAIKNIRERRVSVDPGYDGVFGKIHLFPHEKTRPQIQQRLF